MADYSDEVPRDMQNTVEITLRLLRFIRDLRRRVEASIGGGGAGSAVPSNPTGPATDRQMALIEKLAREGVISRKEVAALGSSPTAAQANELLNKHPEQAGYLDLGTAGTGTGKGKPPLSKRFGQRLGHVRDSIAEGPSVPVYNPFVGAIGRMTPDEVADLCTAAGSAASLDEVPVAAVALPDDLDAAATESLAAELNDGRGEDPAAAVYRDESGTYLLVDESQVDPAALDRLIQEREAALEAPVRAATPRQMELVEKLAREGVISRKEVAALGDSPTMAQANALLNKHPEQAGYLDLGELTREADRYEDLGNTQADNQHPMRQPNAHDADPSTPYPDVETSTQKEGELAAEEAERARDPFAYDLTEAQAAEVALAAERAGRTAPSLASPVK